MKVVQTPIKNNYDLYLSDDFGYREFYFNNKWYSGYHRGIDITNIGKIVAVARGKVVDLVTFVKGYDERQSLGNYVVLEHNNCFSVYGHLDYGSNMHLNIGDIVEKGDILGTNERKTTGFSTGLHLHFGIKINGNFYDPKHYLKNGTIIDYGKENKNKDYIYYKIQSGDTLIKIAEKFNTNYKYLQEINNIKNANLIYTGDTLKIPKTKTSNLNIGDKVKIIGKGNSNSYGSGANAYGIGWEREILCIWAGRNYPYQVGNANGTCGFYKESDLKKL